MRTRSVVALVAGLVALAGAAVAVAPTYSSLTHAAGLLIDADSSSGAAPGVVGSEPPFDLLTIDARGAVTKAPEGAPALVPLAAGHRFVPGQTLRVDLAVANDEPDVDAAVTVAVLPADSGGTGQAGTAPNVTPFLRITVVDDTSGEVLIGGSATDPSRGATLADASGMVGRLAARDTAAVADHAAWTAGASGSRHDLRVELYLPDTPAVRALGGGQTALSVMFYGQGED